MNAIAPEVDTTLIAEMLRLTPEQRVDQNDQMLAMIEELRRGLAQLKSLLTTLAAAEIELVLVGGLAAVAQGAPITTFDVDIVHHRTPENVARLIAVLATIDARYRGRPPGEVLRPTTEILSGSGHSLLMTSMGPLDVLGAIEGGRDYGSLLPDTVVSRFGAHEVRILALHVLVELKRHSTRPKDQRVVAILEETLRQQQA